MQGISNRNTHDFHQMNDKNQELFNKYQLEVKVIKRLTESFINRFDGWGEIDDKFSNEELLIRWLNIIYVLAKNSQDINKTAWEIYNNKDLPYFDFTSIEDARAHSRLVEERFLEEVWAYTIFNNECDKTSDEEIMDKIEETLANIQSGNLNL